MTSCIFRRLTDDLGCFGCCRNTVWTLFLRELHGPGFSFFPYIESAVGCVKRRKPLLVSDSSNSDTLCFLHNTVGYQRLYRKKVDLTSTSKVFSMSRMLLTPAHTTAIGVRPSSIKSALISNASQCGVSPSDLRVTHWPKTTYTSQRLDARRQCHRSQRPECQLRVPRSSYSLQSWHRNRPRTSSLVEPFLFLLFLPERQRQVHPAAMTFAPFVRAFPAAQGAWDPILKTRPPEWRVDVTEAYIPILTWPSRIAIVAGIAPRSRTMASTDWAVATFCG